MHRALLGLFSIIIFILGSPSNAEDDDRSVQELTSLLRINPVSEEAYQILVERAESGNARATWSVYLALQNGLGVERDRTLARQWLERAAGTEELPWAITTLGNTVLSQDNDLDRARSLWRRAADFGHVGALRKLSEFDPVEFATRMQLALIANDEPLPRADGDFGPMSRGALGSYLDRRELDPTACDEEISSVDCLRILKRSGFFDAPKEE